MLTNKETLIQKLNKLYSNLADQDVGDEILRDLNDAIEFVQEKFPTIEE